MSILAAAAVENAPGTLVHVVIAAALIAVGLLIVLRLGAFAPLSVSGPQRLESGTSIAGVFAVLLMGFAAWFGAQVAYVGLIRHRIPVNDGGAINVAALPPWDMAVLATLPFIAGLVVLMLGDRLVQSTLPRALGWSPCRLVRGIMQGLIAMLGVLPLMFGAGIGLELFYRIVGYQHPTEHEMLTVLGRSRERVTTYLIIGGATLLAPAFEEFLFRGHLQTLLVGAFVPRKGRALGFPMMPAVPPAPLPPAIDVSNGTLAASVMTPLTEPTPPAPAPAARWAAIAVTSLAFAVMHPGWTWPLIFLLSLALGYAYERTGNLWVPVVMHLVFNAVQTTIFLLARSL